MKRIFAILLAVMFAGQAWAATTFEIGNLKYKVTDETNHYVSVGKGSTALTGELTIPSTVTNGSTTYTVTSIGDWAFERCSGLTTVTIGNSVTSIGNHAFSQCRGLTSVIIPNSVTSIGEGAFYLCEGLTSVTISESVTSIGNYAFSHCSKLTSVTIPNSVENIGDAVFEGCSGLTEINVERSNTKYASQDGVLFNKDKTTIVCYPAGKTETTYNILNSVTSIGYRAFKGCGALTSVTISESATSIDDYAFYGCSGLTTVTIPNSVTSIGSHAFGECSSLTSVTIPNSVTSIGSYAFYECRGLTTTTIPNSVTSIGYDAFGVCSSLSYNTYDNAEYLGNSENPYVVLISMAAANITSCKINENCKVIYSWAFYYCSSLKSVSIPNSVISIGERTFCSCGMNSVTIPNSVTSIGEGAFSGCHSAAIYCECEETSKPSGWSSNWDAQTKWGCKVIRTAANNAEYGNITTDGENYAVKGDDGSLWYLAETENGKATLTATAKDGYRFIKWEDDAEAGSTRTTDVTKSETYTAEFRPGPATFVIDGLKYTTNTDNDNVTVSANTTDLSGNIEIPDKVTYDDVEYTVTSIGSSAFYRCSGLTSVTIPNSVTRIGFDAFNNCSGLTEVIIPESVTYIGGYMFEHCSSLTSITIPNSVTSIGNYAFSGCYRLKSITIPNSVTSIGICAFSGVRNIVYSGSATGSPWGALTINGIIDGDFVYADAEKTQLTAYIGDNSVITIPNTVTSIGYMAFGICSGLTSVTIPNSVRSIDEYAFYDCSGLTSICFEGSRQPKYQSNSFKNVGKTISVFVPRDYTSSSWCEFQVSRHNLVTISATPATCTETGLSEGRSCTCHSRVLIAQTVIPALGHNYGTPTYTWSTDGKSCTATAVCQRDANHIATEEVTATSEETVAATCEEMGTTTYTAVFENELFEMQTKDVIDISVNGHTPESIAFENPVAATCTTVGSYDSVVYCSVCQAELFREKKEILALGHTYSTTITAPTCTTVGYTTHTCSVCEYTYYSDTIAAKGHKADSVEFENIIPATCIAAGSKDSVVFCSVCEVELSREERAIPALGHTEVVDGALAATCTAAGKTEGKHCSVCNAILVAQEEVAAIGHTEVIDAAIAATCTAAGKTEGKHCSVCNETIVAQTEIPALGHEFKDYVYNNDATTTADGTETATCTRGCGATDTRAAAGTKLAETPEKGTVVAESAANAVTIYAHHNIIVVENATDEISVYNAMGALVCRDATPCVRTEINVNAPGVYIVKTGGVVKRVMVN